MPAGRDFDPDLYLNHCLGAAPKIPYLRPLPNALGALRLATFYFVAFVIIPLCVGLLSEHNPNLVLIGLSMWGTAYLFFATWTAKTASLRVSNDLMALWPHIEHTDCAKEAVREIEHKFRKPFPDLIAGGAVIVSLALTLAALAVDLEHFGIHWGWDHPPDALSFGVVGFSQQNHDIHYWEWVFFGAAYAILYYVSARTTYMATFFISVASRLKPRHLHDHYDPWHSPTVRYSLDISRTILMFWTGIALSIATLPLFFGELGHFLQIVVSTSVFFSLVIGTTVFILSEQYVRRAARDTVVEKLDSISESLSQLDKTDTAFDKRYQTLKDHFTHLSQAKTNTSYVVTLLSLTLPLIGTTVKILVDWISSTSGG